MIPLFGTIDKFFFREFLFISLEFVVEGRRFGRIEFKCDFCEWGSFETIVDLANALEVEPYELFLPQGSAISHNERRTKELMKRLRTNFSELVDTMEEFLAE